jgi:hypothetical protein
VVGVIPVVQYLADRGIRVFPGMITDGTVIADGGPQLFECRNIIRNHDPFTIVHISGCRFHRDLLSACFVTTTRCFFFPLSCFLVVEELFHHLLATISSYAHIRAATCIL